MKKTWTLPASQTQKRKFLELAAISGEFPAELLSHLQGSPSYKETIIWSLKKEKLLKTYYRDKLRGYRLGTRAKAALLSEAPERFSFFLTGNTDTNLLKSELSRRLRLHRLAETYVFMQNANVSIFRDEKPDIFSGNAPSAVRLAVPSFYNSREIKEIGMEAVKISGSRMMGALLAPSGLFLVYNSGPYTARWDYRAEQRAKTLIENFVFFRCFPGQHSLLSAQGILLASGMEPFFQLLSGADSGNRCFFLLDGNYEHFYYFTRDHPGETLMRLLCDPDKTASLNALLSQDLEPSVPGLLLENDAVDSRGNPVLFGYFLDIPRISRFLSGLQLQERTGTLICFDFQRDILNRLCGEYVQLQSVSFEKFERRFFP